MDNKKFYKILDSVFDRDRCFERLCRIYDMEKWNSYDEYKKNADYCVDQMKKMGLAEAEAKPMFADGVSVYNDKMVPPAWNARSATLSFPNGEVLADYREIPCSLCMYSSATPKGGIDAEVAGVDDISVIPEDGSLKGKILLTSKPSAAVGEFACKVGAVGILTDFFPLFPGVRDSRDEMKGVHRWDCLHPRKRGLFGFSLAPEQGDMLREMVKTQTVTLHAEVDAGDDEGALYVISGMIPGTDPTLPDVMAYAHLDEPGANDNASGAAGLLELGCCMTKAIEDGLLPRPKHNIRFIIGPEYSGSIGYFHYYPNRKSLCLCVADMIGNEDLDRTHMDVCLDPLASTSYVDAAILAANERYDDYAGTTHFVTTGPFWGGSDNIISDPSLETPSIAFMNYPANSYHSSADSPERIEPDILKRNAMIVGDFLYMVANADEDVCSMLADRLKKLESSFDFENMTPRRAELIRESTVRGLNSLKRLCNTYDPGVELDEIEYDMPEFAKANGGERIPTRIHKGPIFFSAHPEIAADPAVKVDRYLPLFWTDGKRNIWEIAVRSAVEARHDDDAYIAEHFSKLVKYFDVLASVGYTGWAK